MTHLPDVTVLAPLFADDELVGFAASVAHHSDIGGWAAGGWVADARELIQEGVVINPIKLVDAGELRRDVLGLICDNTRTPDENVGDFMAQISIGDAAARRIATIVSAYGLPAYRVGVSALFEYARKRMLAALALLGAQEGSGVSLLDHDDPETAPAIRAHVTVDEKRIVVDLRESSDELESPMNCTVAQAYTCAFYAIQAVTDPTLSVNDGCYSVVEVLTRPGSLLEPRPTAPVSVGWETATRVTDAVLAALSGSSPDKLVAESKGTMGVMGYGGRSPEGAVFAFFEAVGGGYGARGALDGVDGVQAHVQNTADAQIEEVEAAHPLRVVSSELAPDTEGAGRARGGLGIRKEVEFLVPGTWTAASDRRVFAPQGLAGGEPASPQRYDVRPAPDGEWRQVRERVNLHVSAGARVCITTPGGGGIGSPLDRPLVSVLADLADGRISAERAADAYGVVASCDSGVWTVDEPATRSRRELA